MIASLNIHNCRNHELNFTNGSNNYNGVARLRAGGGAAMHKEDLSQEVLWLRPAEGAATQGVLRHRGDKVRPDAALNAKVYFTNPPDPGIATT